MTKSREKKLVEKKCAGIFLIEKKIDQNISEQKIDHLVSNSIIQISILELKLVGQNP